MLLISVEKETVVQFNPQQLLVHLGYTNAQHCLVPLASDGRGFESRRIFSRFPIQGDPQLQSNQVCPKTFQLNLRNGFTKKRLFHCLSGFVGPEW